MNPLSVGGSFGGLFLVSCLTSLLEIAIGKYRKVLAL